MTGTSELERWLAENTIHCERHSGRWHRDRCHDLAHNTDLCDGCEKRPKKLRRSIHAVNLLRRLQHEHIALRGMASSQTDPRSDVTMTNTNPWGWR